MCSEWVILGQHGDAAQAIACQPQPVRIDRRLGDADVEGVGARQVAQYVGTAGEDPDGRLGPVVQECGRDPR